MLKEGSQGVQAYQSTQLVYPLQPGLSNNISGTVPHMYNPNITSQPQQMRMTLSASHMSQYTSAAPFIQTYNLQNPDVSTGYSNYPMSQQYITSGNQHASYPTYQPMTYQQRSPFQPVYVVQGYQNGVVIPAQAQPHSSRYYSQNQMPQHIPPHQTQQIQPPVEVPKKIPIILTDPKTGEIIPNFVKKEPEKVHQHPTFSGANAGVHTPTEKYNDSKKAQLNAAFAAQVAAMAEKKNNEEILKESQESFASQMLDKIEVADATPSTIEDEEAVGGFIKGYYKDDPADLANEVNTVEIVSVESYDTLHVEVPLSNMIGEETIDFVDETVVETLPEILVDQNSLIDDVKLSSTLKTAQHKKKKKSYKSYDTKEVGDDILSAFVDKPKVEEIPETIKEVKKDFEMQPEELTWENKIIGYEIINNEDDEEQEVLRRKVETKVSKSEDIQDTIDIENEKRQYNRDFLLQFQFAPICISKPLGLPDIDIVLNEAHAPTKALVPGQRLTTNDFIPGYMKQVSGGRSSGGGRSGKERDRRVGSGGGNSGSTSSGQQKKIVNIPQFEKIELHKSENAWVRPAELLKDLPEEEKERDELARSIRGILNKLTPQKFISLLEKMKELKIDTKEKLEIAIDLIFEKAVSEPVFSVAYANLCHRLTDSFKQPMTDNSTPNGTITFRRILLNKCQKEFDKDSSDEKLLEEDKNKTFDTDAESKLWKAELDQREIMNRRRMLGNIRFIGELFKLKMISETIMHDCVIKLLKCEKLESAEDQLECLCKLLATIGKDLDHPKAKPRVDQYFTQMSKIIDRKKISTRIKFAIKDIIDLRSCNWIPRRDDSNPKTIDQIHKEAKDEEKEMEKIRQQDKMRPKERSSQRSGGRDSPAMRGGGGPPASGDGWTSIPTKSRNISATSIDVTKFKVKKNDSEKISLGPGGFKNSWSRGASGGSSRSSSGASTSAEPDQQRPNRYDLLGDQAQPSGIDSKRGSRGSNTSRNSSAKSVRDDRTAIIRAVQDMTTNNSQPPIRLQHDDSPRSGAQTPNELVDTPIDQEALVTVDEMRKKTKSTINEYLSIKDINEAIVCLKEVKCPYLHYIFVEEAITIVIEMKSEERKSVGALLHDMIGGNVITVDQLCNGLAAIVENAPDYAVDIPHFYKYLGETIGPMVYDGALPLNRVKDTLEPLVKPNKAGDVMAEALSVAVQIAGKEDLVSELWSNSSIKWEMLLNNDENVDKFVKEKKMEFLMNTSSNKSYSSNILKGLLRILNEKGENDKITSYIENEGGDCKNDPHFIKDLTSMICKSTLIDGPSNTCTCSEELLKNRKNILLKYIAGNKQLELYALYGIQQLLTTLDHPIGLARVLFQELYNNDVISEETFYTWESSKEFPDGKGVTISSVKDFISWLRQAEEESNEEDSALVFN